MAIAQLTTPTFNLTFSEDGLDLTQADEVYVTFRSGTRLITKTGAALTVGEKNIQVYLDQEETAQMREGSLFIQANWIMGENRYASRIEEYNVEGQLLKEVIEE